MLCDSVTWYKFFWVLSPYQQRRGILKEAEGRHVNINAGASCKVAPLASQFSWLLGHKYDSENWGS